MSADADYDAEYHRMVHPLAEGRGCGCRCPKCYDRSAGEGEIRCRCPECASLEHPDF